MPFYNSQNPAPTSPNANAIIAGLELSCVRDQAPEPLAKVGVALPLSVALEPDESVGVEAEGVTTTVDVSGSSDGAAVISGVEVGVRVDIDSLVEVVSVLVGSVEAVVVVDSSELVVVDVLNVVLELAVLPVVLVEDEIEVVELESVVFCTWNQVAATGSPNPAALTNPAISKSRRFDRSLESVKKLSKLLGMLNPEGCEYIKSVYLCAMSPPGGVGGTYETAVASVKFLTRLPSSDNTSEAPARLGCHQCRNWTLLFGSWGLWTS